MYQIINFLISQPKHMLWVLKRTVSLRGKHSVHQIAKLEILSMKSKHLYKFGKILRHVMVHKLECRQKATPTPTGSTPKIIPSPPPPPPHPLRSSPKTISGGTDIIQKRISIIYSFIKFNKKIDFYIHDLDPRVTP